MLCPNCGGQIENEVCTQCGAAFTNADAHNVQQQFAGAQPQPNNVQPQNVGAQPQPNNTQPQYANVQQPVGSMTRSGFVEPDEKVIMSIGNSTLQNFFTNGFIGTTGATLTNKRFYYSGKAVSPGSAIMQKTKCIVELSEVTGVEIIHKDKMFLSILLAAIMQILAIAAFATKLVPAGIILEVFVLIAVGIGILSIKNTLCVMFKGGSIMFSVKLFGMDLCSEFLRLTLIARKNYISGGVV